MRKGIQFLISFLLLHTLAQSQVFVEHFEDGSDAYFTVTGSGYTGTVATGTGELTITGDGTGGAFDPLILGLHDDMGTPQVVDMSGNNKIFVRAKSSIIGTSLQLNVRDELGYINSLGSLTRTLTNDFVVLEFDLTGGYSDGGFGGTPCMAGPCPVDPTTITDVAFFVEPGAGGFVGDIVIDYISFGAEAEEVIMSDIFQEHFDMPTSLNGVRNLSLQLPPVYNYNLINDTELQVLRDGLPVGGPFSGFVYSFYGQPGDVPLALPFHEGEDKVFIKMKSTVPNTSIMLQLVDIDSFQTTLSGQTTLVGTEYDVYEFDFTGAYLDGAFGGISPCMTSPCPVDSSQIVALVALIEPGSGVFDGELIVDYISIGTSLEPPGPEAVLVYEDRFNNEEVEFTTPVAGYSVTEAGTEMTITGDGTAAAFSVVSYGLHDKETGEAVILDIGPALGKMYLKMRTAAGTESVSAAIVDANGYVSNSTLRTVDVGTEDTVFEFDFSGASDGGFGGTPCTAGPCPLDQSAIASVVLFVRAFEGGFNGDLHIDYLSFGTQLGADPIVGIPNYLDEVTDVTINFLGDAPAGHTVDVVDGAIQLVGDGSGFPFAFQVYSLHDADGGVVVGDLVGSGDTVFIHARSTTTIELGLSVVDLDGFSANFPLLANDITSTEYATYAYDYSSAYTDGGFGGTSCETGPCPVDGTRISTLVFFPALSTGGFSGTLDIDWISFGPRMVNNVDDVPELESLILYPNPVQERMAIEYQLAESGQVGVRIFDMLGREVFSQAPSQRQAGHQFDQLDLSGLSNGMYYLQMSFDGRLMKGLSIQKQ